MDWSMSPAKPNQVSISGQAPCSWEIDELCATHGLKSLPERFAEWQKQLDQSHQEKRAQVIDWAKEIFPAQDMRVAATA